jgi:SEC-C motif-containing protein
MTIELCSCDTKKPFADCCGPYIKGGKVPANAVDLMRARYTAHVRQEIDFIMDTLSAARKKDTDRKETETWARDTQWESLEIQSTEKGGPGDDVGQVTFVAKFRENGEAKEHHELATFIKVNGKWQFEDGRLPPQKPIKSEGPKIGRNDPCPCGSGKKYKKCHGKE